jgi:protein-tyrosine phosphatase
VIDLHCHLLPGIDDGAKTQEQSLDMARMAVADGIRIVACTPHIMPGVYNNSGRDIRIAVAGLQQKLDEAGISLLLVYGADVHIAPNLLQGLQEGRVLPLNRTRYFLLEPTHHLLPPRFEEFIFDLLAAGYVPIITHPERLSWIETQYDMLHRLARSGVWMQLTGGSLLGKFGRRAAAWSERMLQEGIVHLLATDAHDTERRPPLLRAAVEAAARIIGEDEAHHLVVTRPVGVLKNVDPTKLPQPLVDEKPARTARPK